MESQQGVESATSQAHSLKQTVNSLNTELDALRSQLSSVSSQHTSLQVVICLQCVMYGILVLIINPLKGRGVNWLHLAIQV